MAWTTVKDWAPAETVSAAMMDTYVSDNTQYLYENRFGNGYRNVLVNPHMEVWQAGTTLAITSSATPQYLADQWCHRRNGATGATVSRQTGPTGQLYTLRVQRDSGNSNTTAIETMQPLETVESIKLAGQTCQLKLNLKAGANFSATSSLVSIKVTYGTGTDQAPPASGWTGTTDALSTTQVITTTATDYEFNSIVIPTSATQVQVLVSFTPVGTASTNDYFELAGAQLTVGKSPGWERLPMAMQELRCRRFFNRLVSGNLVRLTIAQATTATAGLGTLTFPPMRILPSLTLSAASHFTALKADASGGLALSALALTAPIQVNTAGFDFTSASGLTAGQACQLHTNNASATLDLNARL